MDAESAEAREALAEEKATARVRLIAIAGWCIKQH